MAVNQAEMIFAFANVQMAVEAVGLGRVLGGNATLEEALVSGNPRSSVFTSTVAAKFANEWTLIARQSNADTGFSGTLFQYKGPDNPAAGLVGGQLVMSFRSTRFIDDAVRDNQSTNAMEVQPFGWAFGQIADMRKWVDSLRTSGEIPNNHVWAVRQQCAVRDVGRRPDRRRRLAANLLRTLALSCAFIGASSLQAQTQQSIEWREFVKVAGQSQPVPRQWLDTEEGRIAHSLRLPDSLPQAIPFDFDKAKWRAWLPGAPKPAVQYFAHLCNTEAGQWVFKTVQNVEGLYFARPQGTPTTESLTDPYALEMPWIQRTFILQGDRAHDHGTWFVQPPIYNYLFVEQPRRDVEWQARINDPYIRLFGYTREVFVKEGQVVAALNEKTPMQVVGVPRITARHGYTWRGLRRPRDREFGIAGGELLIYDIQTQEVLAVRRQFLISSRNPRGPGGAMWEVAARCREPSAHPATGEFSQFAFDVLKTINPSTTKKE